MNTSEKSTRISQSKRAFFPGVKEEQAESLEEAGQWRGQTLQGWTGSYPCCGGQKKLIRTYSTAVFWLRVGTLRLVSKEKYPVKVWTAQNRGCE